MTPPVSVIIPTFNRAAAIARTVQSVLDQSYRNLELIVVDDGSTDSTEDVLLQFGNRIRLIRQSQAGPSAARNRGIEAASGSIFAFLDSDDVWLPHKIEEQVRVFSLGERTMSCCICDAIVIDELGRRRTAFQNAGLSIAAPRGYWSNPSEFLMSSFVLFNQVVAVRREAMEEVGLFKEDLRLLEDYDLAVRLSTLGGWGIVKEPLVIKYNDTGGIGVVAMRDPKQLLPAREKVLQSLLSEPRINGGEIKVSLEKSLRDVQTRMQVNDYLDSDRASVRLLGRARFEGLRVKDIVRRILSGRPKAQVSRLNGDGQSRCANAK